jgi:hypothetical protein
MALPSARIRTVREAQLAALCGLGVDGLYKLADKFDALGPVVNPAKLRLAIEEYTDADTARTIQRFLIGVATAVRRGFLTVPDMLDTIQRSLVADHVQTPSPETWQKCRQPVERLLASKCVVLSAKSADLASDFERYCVTSRIITDIRPVFDTGNGPIVGATITHTLKLEYLSADRTHGNISIALDMDDIEHLRDACIEAVRKGNVAKALMDEKRNGYLDTLLPGQERK